MFRGLVSLAIASVILTQSVSVAHDLSEFSYNSVSGATDDGKTAETLAKSNYSNILIAQAFLDARCPEEYVYLQGETVNYTVKICGSRSTGLPTHYLSESKKNGSGFILPLSSYTPGRFVVRDGKYTYILDTKAQTLTIRFPRKRPRIERFTIDLP